MRRKQWGQVLKLEYISGLCYMSWNRHYFQGDMMARQIRINYPALFLRKKVDNLLGKLKLSGFKPWPLCFRLCFQNISPVLWNLSSGWSGTAWPTWKNKEIQTAPLLLFQHFTFTHFTELIKVKDPLKRAFYEQQTIKGNWSSRELKGQLPEL